jgi:hypothetical protein
MIWLIPVLSIDLVEVLSQVQDIAFVPPSAFPVVKL